MRDHRDVQAPISSVTSPDSAGHDIALREKPGVATQSISEEPYRRVVVLPRNV
jgi:hypothetical protein